MVARRAAVFMPVLVLAELPLPDFLEPGDILVALLLLLCREDINFCNPSLLRMRPKGTASLAMSLVIVPPA